MDFIDSRSKTLAKAGRAKSENIFSTGDKSSQLITAKKEGCWLHNNNTDWCHKLKHIKGQCVRFNSL